MPDSHPQPDTPPAGGATRSIAVADRLRAAILAGDLKPGERLQEVRLADELGVSRTPVRAALHALAGEALLDYAPNRGYSVRDFPVEDLLDAYEIRAALEGIACRFAAERGLGADATARIERALADGDRIFDRPGELDAGDLAVYREVNAIIHDTILAASRNRMLAEMTRLSHNLPQVSNRHIVAFERRDVWRRHEDHHRIFEAITAGEPWRAELLMREHVTGVKASMIRRATGVSMPR